MMDCSGYACYIRNEDGTFLRIDRIPEVQTLDDGKYDPEMIRSMPQEMTMQIKLTHRSMRRLRKTIHGVISRRRREIRREKRRAEKERRRKLRCV